MQHGGCALPDDVRLDKGFTRKEMTTKAVIGLVFLGRGTFKDADPEIVRLV